MILFWLLLFVASLITFSTFRPPKCFDTFTTMGLFIASLGLGVVSALQILTALGR